MKPGKILQLDSLSFLIVFLFLQLFFVITISFLVISKQILGTKQFSPLLLGILFVELHD